MSVRLGFLLSALLALAGCATGGYSSGLAWSSAEPQPLERWMESELEPYLQEKLTTHPRFKGETITVMTMQGDEPQPAPDAFSAAIARRITQSLLATRGVNLVWEGGRAMDECLRRGDAHYVLAVDLQQSSPASHRLGVRALDREEGLWVSGFGLQWDGRLTRGEYAAFKRRADTQAARGLRNDPFRAGETDLLAARLAGELGERFCGFVGEPLAVYAEVPADAPAALGDTVSLVANNLARSPHIRAVGNRSEANLILSGRLYAIDGELHQLWVQGRPAGDGPAFPVVDVQAYVELPRGTAAMALDTGARPSPRRADALPAARPAITAVHALTPNEAWMCRRGDPWRRGARVLRPGESLNADGCFALELEVSGDGELYLLRRDAEAGLVRMLPARCGRHAKVSTRIYEGGTVRFPSPGAGWEHALWPAGPAVAQDIWIAIVLRPAAAGEAALSRHLARLPDDCTAGDGVSLQPEPWLAKLDDLLAARPAAADMRVIELPVGPHAAALERR